MIRSGAKVAIDRAVSAVTIQKSVQHATRIDNGVVTVGQTPHNRRCDLDERNRLLGGDEEEAAIATGTALQRLCCSASTAASPIDFWRDCP